MVGKAPGRPPVCRRSSRRLLLADETGAVTVEAALALCALTVFLALRCADAARELARLAARGEPDRGRAVAAQLAPPSARLDLAQDGDTVVAMVSARLIGALPLSVGGRAVAASESVGSP